MSQKRKTRIPRSPKDEFNDLRNAIATDDSELLGLLKRLRSQAENSRKTLDVDDRELLNEFESALQRMRELLKSVSLDMENGKVSIEGSHEAESEQMRKDLRDACGDPTSLQPLVEWIEKHQPADSKEEPFCLNLKDAPIQQLSTILARLRKVIEAVEVDTQRIWIDPVEKPFRGAPTKAEVARRRGRIFAMLHRRQLEHHEADETRRFVITKAQVAETGITNAETAESDFHEIYDFCHSMRLTEDGLKAGKYAFSNYLARQARNAKAKADIASLVSSLINEGSSISCGEGSTTAACLHAILEQHKHVAVVTNNLLVFDTGAIEHAEIFLCGGDYHADSHATTGARAVSDFKKRPCDYAVVGAYGIDFEGRCYTYHHQDCAVQVAAISAAKRKIVVACDISKFGRSGRWSFLNLSEFAKEHRDKTIVLVTNHYSEEEHKKIVDFMKTMTAHENIRVLKCAQIE